MIRRQFLFAGLAAILVASVSFPALAGENATREEAQSMVERAADFLKDNERDKAFVVFSNLKGRFIDRDLYIVVWDIATGNRLVQPYKPELIGKSVATAKDAAGKEYGKELMYLASTAGSGWVDYLFPDPVTKEVAPKSMYILRVGTVFVGCGAYKDKK